MSVCIRGGRVVDPAQALDQVLDVYIDQGRVLALGAAPAGFVARQVIDAQGLVVCPGLVDLQARLREPGFEFKGTIASETRAAVRGGITTLCCPPDTSPVVDSPAVVELIHQRSQLQNLARVVVLGALTKGLKGAQITEMGALREAGVVGVSQGYKFIENTLILRRALEYANSFGLTTFLFSEDPWLRGKGVAHESGLSTRMGLPGVPVIAETIGVARDLALVDQTGTRAHFLHISSEKAMRKIGRARHDGLPVTASVTAHHLHLTEMDIMDYNVNAFVRPPLRSQRDRDGLRQGLREGIIDVICSDHQPHDADAKLGPFDMTEPGMSTLETFLPLVLRLVDEEVLSLSAALACVTSRPAAILGIEAGSLRLGMRADVCIFDPEQYWTLHQHEMLSGGKNSAFLGWEFKGKVKHTLVQGQLVYSDHD